MLFRFAEGRFLRKRGRRFKMPHSFHTPHAFRIRSGKMNYSRIYAGKKFAGFKKCQRL